MHPKMPQVIIPICLNNEIPPSYKPYCEVSHFFLCETLQDIVSILDSPSLNQMFFFFDQVPN